MWLCLLDLLRASASEAPCQRLPFIVAHSWSRLVSVLQQPGHRLFRPVSRQLLREARAGRLEIGRVPLFFELFNR